MNRLKVLPMIATLAALMALLPMQAAASVSGVDHATLLSQVRHEIVMLPYLTVFDNIDFSVRNGNVILSGAVTRPTLKRDAERVVKAIEGVRTVENHIKVLPPSPQDDRLRTVLYQAIYHNPTLSRYAMTVISPIRIIVDSGKVTLEGVVDNQSDKDLANILAKSVPGIFSVTNHLRVRKPV